VRLQRRYRPAHLRLLFIGEAPPVSGRFFYRRDSGLYRAIRDSFRILDASITDATFLDVFRASGCYLIDVCPDPVDHRDPPSRRASCLASEIALSRKIKGLRPPTIVTMVRSIQENVERAASRAGWRGRLIELPYPGRWTRHRELFVNMLVPELKSLNAQNYKL
jgi:hypothetical protein